MEEVKFSIIVPVYNAKAFQKNERGQKIWIEQEK